MTMGLIEVSERTSPQRAAAIRERLMNPPVRTKPRIEREWLLQYDAHVNAWSMHIARVMFERMMKPPDEREWFLQQDAHVNARAVYMLKEIGCRVMAIPIIKEMCREYGVSYHDICSHQRTKKICFPRQKMMWAIRHRTMFSFPEIGRKFGGRDHTTVIHAINKIDRLIASNDPSVADLKGWIND
jgi:hypothetical protein